MWVSCSKKRASDKDLPVQDPSGTTKRKLLTQIEQLKVSKEKASTDNKTPNVNSGDNQVMYELMMKPDTSKMEERKKMALFESRLESLEKVLGPSQQKLVRLFCSMLQQDKKPKKYFLI